jgi:hypothetical protein
VLRRDGSFSNDRKPTSRARSIIAHSLSIARNRYGSIDGSETCNSRNLRTWIVGRRTARLQQVKEQRAFVHS